MTMSGQKMDGCRGCSGTCCTGLGSNPCSCEPIEGWQEAPGGVFSDAGDVGGDWQAGKSYSVRFIRDDNPNAMVTVYTYPIQHDGNDGCGDPECRDGWIELEQQVEYLIGSDPEDRGGSETWSDTEHRRLSLTCMMPTLSAAEGEAWLETSTIAASSVCWNGEPFYGHGARKGD